MMLRGQRHERAFEIRVPEVAGHPGMFRASGAMN